MFREIHSTNSTVKISKMLKLLEHARKVLKKHAKCMHFWNNKVPVKQATYVLHIECILLPIPTLDFFTEKRVRP